MTRNIADEFIEEVGNQELSAPIYDSHILIQGSGWNSSEFYSKYYESKMSFPILVSVDRNEGVLYISQEKELDLSKEIFRRSWKDDELLEKITREFNKKVKVVDKVYEIFTEDYLMSKNFEELKPLLEDFHQNAWDLNALIFFCIYFDKKGCQELIKELGVDISSERFDEIWDRATVPVALSFEKRRRIYLLSLIKEGKNWDDIAHLCHYFFTTYSKLQPLEESKAKIIEEYGNISADQANELIIKEVSELQEEKTKHAEWLLTLTKEEKKLVDFVQYVIIYRDVRKDYLMKMTTLYAEINIKFFKEIGLDTNDAYYWSFREMKKGPEYLKENKDLIEKRKLGYSVLTKTDGTVVEEYGDVQPVKERMDSHYKELSKQDSETEIKGQIGSKGIIKGIAKIVRFYEKDKHKLQKGEILVTGMTRPEFVPLMKIAGGIVTDEGGITCHAAIVSRELGIPCVIGTKIATKVLKDGDMVEVDAIKGIVRIIN
jgi:phosphohistidine swiveling domain-containing protein